MNRGDVVICAAPGDYGKPRPAVVVQSDLFNSTHPSIVVCPLTSDLQDAVLFRVRVQPTAENGLRQPSQVMIDKVVSLHRSRIRQLSGALTGTEMARVDAALRLWLSVE